MIRIITIVLLNILPWMISFAQSTKFEGEIHFVTTYTYFPPSLEHYREFLPKTMDIYIQNHLVCKEGPTGFGNGYQIHIRNLKSNTGYTAMRVGNDAVAFKRGPKEFDLEMQSVPKPVSIEYTDEMRIIGGYPCNKALVFLSGISRPFIVYYTEQIPRDAFVIYQDLKGFPLYFEGSLNGVLYHSEAKSVNPGKQSDSRFILPQEYNVVSYEEFKNTLIKEVED